MGELLEIRRSKSMDLAGVGGKALVVGAFTLLIYVYCSSLVEMFFRGLH